MAEIETSDVDKISPLFPRVWAAFSLLLVAATFRLWFVTPIASFPSIPLVGSGTNIPTAALWIPPIVLVGALFSIVGVGERCKKCWWLASGWLAFSFLLDQHRLQPWAYQLAIYGIILGALDWPRARRLLIPLAASVYIYSALGKLDYQFAHTVGQEILTALLSPFGGLPEGIGPQTRATLALIFPASELFLGIGLLLRPTRKIAGVIVMLMHALLVAILGPWSLDHSAGVLVWNVALMSQAYLLMVKSDKVDRVERAERVSVPWFVWIVLVGALVAPLVERAGYWDHWLSWALYAPHTSRVDIEVHRSAIESLDTEVQSFMEEDPDDDGWQRLLSGQWSLQTRGVPIYPQARYQLALAIALAKKHGLEGEIRAKSRTVSDRWTGQRTERLMLGRREMEKEMQSFWLSRSF